MSYRQIIWHCKNLINESQLGCWPVFPLRCATAQLHNTTRQFAQCYLIFAHFQHSEFSTVYICRIALLTLGTFHCLWVCMVAQLHELSAQQNKHLLSVGFSWREHCCWLMLSKKFWFLVTISRGHIMPALPPTPCGRPCQFLQLALEKITLNTFI